MAVNFCCPKLKTKINSPAVSCEGHDVSNLLSSNPLHMARGFLAEGFTKPPISIFLNFYCNVNISHILIWTEVGCQKSNGLDLFVNPESLASEEKNDCHSSKSCSAPAVKIGSCKLKNEPGMAFQKYNYRVAPVIPPNFLVKHFFTSSRGFLENANALEIKIFSTANSTVPALKKIEVWGHPSRSCPEDIKKLIFTLWNQANSKVGDKPRDSKKLEDNKKDSKELISKQTVSKSETLIQDEFLDPITCNVMAIPMTLPCGKVVDLSTLEKFIAAESSWGRCPSDPFTGVPFTKSVFAVPDTALKSRIDQFLLEHGHLEQFKGVGRTVGQGNQNYSNLLKMCGEVEPMGEQRKSICSLSEPHVPHMLSLNALSQIRNEISCESNHTQTSSSSNVQVLSNVPGGSNQFEAVNSDIDGVNTISRNCGIKRKNCANAKSSSDVVFKKLKDSSGIRNHEEILEDSLDYAIGSVLSGLPSFVKISMESKDSNYKISQRSGCSNCHSSQCLFSLPCEHLLCRACLVNASSGKTDSMNCIVCSYSYTSGDVKRFHVM